ncbi:NrdH-redoxin [Metabacillus sp. KIGAM252]|uniref:NrdH-redoxin n=1 Tax=Metabacillus flavus TaxID=2823519 RepID=A0ABS5LD29_9BACI|nr:glutaredoxin domain-containing protein [Metabacillus flavus]MBS2968656.1 NrdH-redoxin [Metabacillus flavus]
MTKKITVYTQPDCPPCKIVKQFLDHHHVMFDEIDISKDQIARDHLIKNLQSYSTPTITVDGFIVKGFDLPALEKLVL